MAVPKEKKTAVTKPKKGVKKEKRNIFQSIGQYFKEVRSEFRKVMWPDRKEVSTSTMVVFITVVFFVAFTGVVDLVFAGSINRLLPLIGG